MDNYSLKRKYIKLKSGEMIIISLFIMYYFLPSIFQVVPFYTAMLLSLIYLVICYNKKKFFEMIEYIIIILFICLLYYLLADVYTIKEFISKFYFLFMDFFPLFILYRLVTYGNIKQIKTIYLFISIIYIFVLFNTLSELSINPNATRSFSNSIELSQNNIGTYDFVYSSGALIVFMLSSFSLTKQRWIKALGFLGIVTIIYFLLVAQYTLALLSVVILFFIDKFKQTRNNYIKLILILSIPLILFSLPYILKSAADSVPSEQMAIRLNEISLVLTNDDSNVYYLEGRMVLYKQAIKAFLDSPLYGNKILNFDAHSTFLAIFARIGILGGLSYVYLFLRSKKLINHLLLLKKREKWIFTSVFMYLIIQGLTNPINSALMTNAVTWLYVPLGIYLLKYASSRHNNIKGSV